MKTELFDKQGNFSIFLALHINRYSNEYNMSRHDIIQVFKNAEITIKEMIKVSFGGYEAFKSAMKIIISKTK